MEDLLYINIDGLSKEELIDISNKIKKYISPYNSKLGEICARISEINKQEYLKSRGIKNYPKLKELINILGEEYKDIIIDIDEFLGIKRYSSIRIYSELMNSCERRNIEMTDKLYTNVKRFMLDNNIIIPQYEILCPRCHNTILTFISDPKSETFIEDLQKEVEDWMEIEDSSISCDECDTYIDLTDEHTCIQPCSFYKIVRD